MFSKNTFWAVFQIRDNVCFMNLAKFYMQVSQRQYFKGNQSYVCRDPLSSSTAQGVLCCFLEVFFLNPFKNRIDFFHVCCISVTSDHSANATFLLLLILQTCLSLLSSVGILI